MTSKTEYGITPVTVGDDEYTLTPNLAAVRKIESRYNGLRPAIEAVMGLSVDACALVIAAGAGLSAKEAENVADTVYANGVSNIAPQILPFLLALMNPAQADAEAESGNVKKTKAKTAP